MRKHIKVEGEADAVQITVPMHLVIQLRENLISQPGLTVLPTAQRTPLEDLAIKFTTVADMLENRGIVK